MAKANTEMKVYLSKRAIVRSASAAVKKAAHKAMDAAGYVVTAENGYVVKRTAEGKVTRLSKLEKVKRPLKIVLH